MKRLLSILFSALIGFSATALAAPNTTTVPGTLLTVPIVTAAPTSTIPGLILTPGVSPSGAGLVNGSIWTITSPPAVNVRVNGTTYNLLNAANGGYTVTNVVTEGADNTCTTDSTVAFQAAINTGNTVYIPHGCYIISADLVISARNQIIFGDGPGFGSVGGSAPANNGGSVIYVKSNSGFTHGVFFFDSGEQGPQLQDFTITFLQPNTSTRASLTTYVPPIYAQNTPRFRLFNMRLTQCIVCIDMRGNSGGSYIENTQLGGYGTLSTGGGVVLIDGSLDTVRIDNTQWWPFDMSLTQAPIEEDSATIGLSSGRMDDLEISGDLFLVGTGASFFWGTAYTPGLTFGTIVSSGFDSYSGIVAAGEGTGGQNTGPILNIAASYFTPGNNANYAISMTAGHITLASVQMQQQYGGSNPPIQISDSTGISDLEWDSGWFLNSSADVTDIYITGDAFAALHLGDVHFYKTQNTNYSYPIIDVESEARAAIHNNFVDDVGTGSGTFIKIANDNFNNVIGNAAPGWTLTFPSSPVYGIYTCNNNSPTSNPCGTGGSGSPGGSNGNVQFNNGGSFGGASFLNVSSTDPQLLLSQQNSGGETSFKVFNNETANSTLASVYAFTGTTNAYIVMNNQDGSAKTGTLGTGAGDTGGLYLKSLAGPITLDPDTYINLTTLSASSPLCTDASKNLTSSCTSTLVTALAGTSGEINASGSTGSITLSLPSTITSNETFSGTVDFTGTVELKRNNPLVDATGGSILIGTYTIGGSIGTQIGDTPGDGQALSIEAANNIIAQTNNTYELGSSGDVWTGVYATTFYGGTGSTAGVSCSGSPTSSFASVGGIVTHC